MTQNPYAPPSDAWPSTPPEKHQSAAHNTVSGHLVVLALLLALGVTVAVPMIAVFISLRWL